MILSDTQTKKKNDILYFSYHFFHPLCFLFISVKKRKYMKLFIFCLPFAQINFF